MINFLAKHSIFVYYFEQQKKTPKKPNYSTYCNNKKKSCIEKPCVWIDLLNISNPVENFVRCSKNRFVNKTFQRYTFLPWFVSLEHKPRHKIQFPYVSMAKLILIQQQNRRQTPNADLAILIWRFTVCVLYNNRICYTQMH